MYILLFILFLFPSIAFGDWLFLGYSNKNKIFIDNHSIINESSLKRASVKIVFNELQSNPDFIYNFDTSENLVYFDCLKYSFSVVENSLILDSKIINSSKIDLKKSSYEHLNPDSIFNLSYSYVCPSNHVTAKENHYLINKSNLKEKKININVNVKPLIITKNNIESPINIDNTIYTALKTISFIYKFNIKDIKFDNKKIQLIPSSGNLVIFNKSKYYLYDIEVYLKSEHLIKNKQFDGEIQLIHKDNKNHQLNICVLFNINKDNSNAIAIKKDIKIASLIPQKTNYYYYNGTTTENPITPVNYAILKNPINVSIDFLDTSKFKNNHKIVDNQNLILE